ncbi:MAG: hypothetical protein ABJA34_10655 [Pseudonocardiales bacterium]
MNSFVFDRAASPMRWVVAAAAAAAAAAHVPVIAPHLREAPYMGVLFLVLTGACALLAVAALMRDTAAVYALSALTCGLAVLGYAATRLVAFPLLADDVGDWWEPLGVVSVVSETVVILAALSALRAARPNGAANSVFRPPSTAPNGAATPVAGLVGHTERRNSS